LQQTNKSTANFTLNAFFLKIVIFKDVRYLYWTLQL